MKTKVLIPGKKSYPYMAVHSSTAETNFASGENFLPEDVYVVSKLKDGEVIVSKLTGGENSWATEHENEYTPLPTGTKIEIIQD